MSHHRDILAITFLVIVGRWGTSGQNSDSTLVSGASSNCAGGGGSDLSQEVYDLQERVICLEQLVEQLVGTHEVVRDCSEVAEDDSGVGIHRLSPNGADPFDALCVFNADGKWTVIQQRLNGDTPFNRIWVEYRNGFGTRSATGNFWLGLEHMHQITKQRQYTLRVELTDWDDSVHSAEYALFSIGTETSRYAFQLRDYTGGDLPDALLHISHGTPFSTNDQDHDTDGSLNCAAHFQTGWWHTRCYAGQLNGPYRLPPNNMQGDAKGITWMPYKGEWYSMKGSRMLIKPTYDE